MKRSTFKLLFYINRAKVKSDGTTAVLCRISIDGKVSVLTTGIYCSPEDWNARKGIIKTERENNQLTAFRQRLEQTYENILKQQGVISAELLKNTVAGINATPTMLLQAGEEERERLRLRAIEINSTSSYRQSKVSQSNLRQYLLTLKLKDIAFTDITEEFGEGYKLYLKSKGYKPGHINHCLTWLNRLIYIAVDRELLRFNPLADVKYEKKDPPKLRHISRNELKLIMERPMLDRLQELTRRAFIFSCFTALAYVDVKRLYPHHIAKTAEGRLYIRINRKKTDVEAFIPLHPVAGQILSLYNTADDTKPVFPLPNRDQLWYCINEIGFLAGVKGTLGYHQSRHTCGTLMLSAGIPIESISKMMGHTNISSTQVYARVTDDKISEDMDKLMERRRTKEPGTVIAIENRKGIAR
jgi:site-specific recombinase XerD